MTMKRLLIVWLLLLGTPAWAAHKGPCLPWEVGRLVTMCGVADDRTVCKNANQIGSKYIVGSCHNPTDPCGDGKCDDATETAESCPVDCSDGGTACCVNSMGGKFTVNSCNECKKNASSIQCVEQSHVENGLCKPNCLDDGFGTRSLAVPLAAPEDGQSHVPGKLQRLPPDQCEQTIGLFCCGYNSEAFGVYYSQADTCDCPDLRPDVKISCTSGTVSGDGRDCLPLEEK